MADRPKLQPGDAAIWRHPTASTRSLKGRCYGISEPVVVLAITPKRVKVACWDHYTSAVAERYADPQHLSKCPACPSAHTRVTLERIREGIRCD